MRFTFQSYPATARAVFTCALCGKPNRTRTFRVECTDNPFNTKDDGTRRTPAEVKRQSQELATADRAHFLQKPVCKECDDRLSFTEKLALQDERAALTKSEAAE